MSVFVNYEGPNLGKKQNQVVRSQAMVVVRGQQRKAKAIADVVANETPSLHRPRQ